MPAPEPIIVLRIVAAPHALDAVSVSPGPAMRLAPDELWVVGDTRPVVGDPHAIVFRDTGHVCLTWSEPMAAATRATGGTGTIASPSRYTRQRGPLGPCCAHGCGPGATSSPFTRTLGEPRFLAYPGQARSSLFHSVHTAGTPVARHAAVSASRARATFGHPGSYTSSIWKRSASGSSRGGGQRLLEEAEYLLTLRDTVCYRCVTGGRQRCPDGSRRFGSSGPSAV
mgnify:CR=1 FL=1